MGRKNLSLKKAIEKIKDIKVSNGESDPLAKLIDIYDSAINPAELLKAIFNDTDNSLAKEDKDKCRKKVFKIATNITFKYDGNKANFKNDLAAKLNEKIKPEQIDLIKTIFTNQDVNAYLISNHVIIETTVIDSLCEAVKNPTARATLLDKAKEKMVDLKNDAKDAVVGTVKNASSKLAIKEKKDDSSSSNSVLYAPLTMPAEKPASLADSSSEKATSTPEAASMIEQIKKIPVSVPENRFFDFLTIFSDARYSNITRGEILANDDYARNIMTIIHEVLFLNKDTFKDSFVIIIHENKNREKFIPVIENLLRTKNLQDLLHIAHNISLTNNDINNLITAIKNPAVQKAPVKEGSPASVSKAIPMPPSEAPPLAPVPAQVRAPLTPSTAPQEQRPALFIPSTPPPAAKANTAAPANTASAVIPPPPPFDASKLKPLNGGLVSKGQNIKPANSGMTVVSELQDILAKREKSKTATIDTPIAVKKEDNTDKKEDNTELHMALTAMMSNPAAKSAINKRDPNNEESAFDEIDDQAPAVTSSAATPSKPADEAPVARKTEKQTILPEETRKKPEEKIIALKVQRKPTTDMTQKVKADGVLVDDNADAANDKPKQNSIASVVKKCIYNIPSKIQNYDTFGENLKLTYLMDDIKLLDKYWNIENPLSNDAKPYKSFSDNLLKLYEHLAKDPHDKNLTAIDDNFAAAINNLILTVFDPKNNGPQGDMTVKTKVLKSFRDNAQIFINSLQQDTAAENAHAQRIHNIICGVIIAAAVILGIAALFTVFAVTGGLALPAISVGGVSIFAGASLTGAAAFGTAAGLGAGAGLIVGGAIAGIKTAIRSCFFPPKQVDPAIQTAIDAIDDAAADTLGVQRNPDRSL